MFLFCFGGVKYGNRRVFDFGVVRKFFGLEIKDIGYCFGMRNKYNQLCSQMKADFI